MAITSRAISWCLCCELLLAISAAPARELELFQSSQATPTGEYTFGIEGPAVDRDGNLFVVNIGKPGTIGQFAPGARRSEKFIDLPEGSVGNALRFDREGTMFIADYKRHNIFALGKDSREPQVWFHSDQMSQPNDITVSSNGTIYASDPNWKGRSGRIWRVAQAADGTVQGEVMAAPRAMGTTNGIDLSPDGKRLYVSESNSGQIWSYAVGVGELTDAKLIRTFEPDTVDGLRTDVAGRIYVARILRGVIAIMQPSGALEREVTLSGKEPTNLAFGGSDGKTVFVTQRQGGFVETFRTDREGREHCLQGSRC
ncbi:SMP-30/gluconolactonase/LRE family protein [Bradyrhizobium australafricanum]|uniref:SMP-30/gluconolactonase/LRE family protein n=1 Tax=Bradyrhizobium australafricanum TaxID=2821406 RepID=UPI001CE28D00|nr:SMP-30/gluconolactonase/LRE family protein [Bradyrhizobium australafricanum]MCA6103575.1 SMP-30/gluconolactonase/LRE family protein [Bradyrhizobium australafricanum]